MKNVKILRSLLITLCVLGTSTINSFAVSQELSLDDLDYTQRKVILENEINKSSEELSTITKEVDLTKEYLLQNENQIVNTQKTYDAKKNVTKYNIGSNNDLMLLEMVLNSDNLGELFRNIDLAKDVYIQKNKALNTLTEKEEQLLVLRERANSKFETLVSTLTEKQEELATLQNSKSELDQLVSRKGDLTFNPNNLLEKSNASVDDIYKSLKGTALYELAPIYIEAENLYGVNALFLVGLTAQESGWGTSRRAVEDNNLTGFGVYNNSSKGLNSQTKRDNILRTAKWLKDKYLTPGQSLYSGFGIRDVNVRYCIGVDGTSDFDWSASISKIASESLDKIN